MPKSALLFAVSLLGILSAGAVGAKTLVTAGKFIKIYDPTIGETEPWYLNDHCFIQDAQGTWHLFGITHAEPAAPLNEISFAHATSPSLVGGPWIKQKPALTVETSAPWNETHLWAPHVIQHDGLYYMFYCGGDRDHTRYKIELATSKDLVNWKRNPKNPLIVDGYDARDPFVLRADGKWYLYYTATSKPAGGNYVVFRVESDDLVHWSGKIAVFTDKTSGTFAGPTESPYVVRRGSKNYLFIGPRGGYDGTDVFVSDALNHWDAANLVGHIPAHAAEVVRDTDGKWYISRAGWGRGGVYLAPLQWHDGLDNADASLKPAH